MSWVGWWGTVEMKKKIVKSHKHSCRPTMELVGKNFLPGSKTQLQRTVPKLKSQMSGTAREGSGIPGRDLPVAKTARVM